MKYLFLILMLVLSLISSSDAADAQPQQPYTFISGLGTHHHQVSTRNPWQLWTKDGQPQVDTEEIVAILKSVLQRDPNHLGANHYYIHAVEASFK
jgi:hypothetical protein